MDDWYKNWFNTEEYLNVYRHRNDEDAKSLIELILSSIGLPRNASVLDLACGAGRHSILFATEGYKVAAVDLSKNLLAVAKKLAKDEKLRIDFIECDLRNFSITANFDLVVNLFTSFGYFENDDENFKIFEVANEHLNKGGYFVIDYFNKNYVIKNLVPESIDRLNGGKIIQRRSINGNRVIKKISIIQNGTEKQFHESVRMYGKDELVREIKKQGLTIKKIFGDFDRNEFEPDISPRLIIIAQK